MDYTNEVTDSGSNASSLKINTPKAAKRTRDNLGDRFTYQKNKIVNLINITSTNKYATLSEVLLHDRSVLQPTQTLSKRVITPKINVIRVKTPANINDKMNLIQNIKEKSQGNVTVSPSGIFTKFHPASYKDYEEIVKMLDEAKVEQFLFLNKSTQPLKVIVRGQSIDMDPDMILEELKKTFPVIKVTQMTKFRTGHKMPLFQMQLEEGPTAREILKFTILLHHTVNMMEK